MRFSVGIIEACMVNDRVIHTGSGFRRASVGRPLFICRAAFSCLVIGLIMAGFAPASDTKKPSPPDDPQALAALAETTSSLRKDGDGYVIEANFRKTKIGDDALAPLLDLRRIRSVLLNDTAITDAGMKTLGKLTTLTNLDLRGCGVSNVGMKHLTGLKKLRGFKLSGASGVTKVDDDGLDALAGLTNLKHLNLE